MIEKVRIVAPSHIHIGNPDLEGSYGRLYGTLGIALKTPRLVIEAHRGGHGCECSRSDAMRVYERLASETGCSIRVRVLEEIPAHVGLGSTTPLYLGIAHAFTELCGRGSFDPVAWAERLGRGTVSALGVYTYMHGGLLFDAGFDPEKRGRVPPLLYRAEPPAWLSILVILPYKPIPRILEIKRREDEILESMPRMDSSMADKLSRIMLMGILGNIAAGEWEKAGKYITLFNRTLGEYWRGPQESIYCCWESEEIITELLRLGAIFAGQSSWGPTVYGGFPSSRVAEAVARVQVVLDRVGGGAVWVTRPATRGAVVEAW